MTIDVNVSRERKMLCFILATYDRWHGHKKREEETKNQLEGATM